VRLRHSRGDRKRAFPRWPGTGVDKYSARLLIFGLLQSVAEPGGASPAGRRLSLRPACAASVFLSLNLAECCWWCGDLQKARAYFERELTICETTAPSALIRSVGIDLSILSAVF
jgi:hypothetical protein